MARVLEHWAIFSSIALTIYSQLIMRWQVTSVSTPPPDLAGKAIFVVELLLKPWVLTALVASFLAGVSWMFVMSRFELSYAFPFLGLNFVLILFAGALFFQESISITKIVGTALVVAGVIVMSRN